MLPPIIQRVSYITNKPRKKQTLTLTPNIELNRFLFYPQSLPKEMLGKYNKL